MTPHPIVTTQDGFALAVTSYGDPATCRAGVLIAPAMGVEQHYYAAFAQHLAQLGYWVMSFDYRGTGASRPTQYKRSLRGFEADVRTWAQHDCAAMVAHMRAQLQHKRLLWVGHSLGGQIFGLVPNREQVAAMLTVASGSGYWLQNTLRLRLIVWWLWFFVVPLALPLFGYFPGRALKKVGDLPRGVMQQWRAWCLNREYLIGCEGEAVRASFAAVATPILSLSFSDDELMSARSIESLHGFYVGAPKQMQRIGPSEVGEKRIGHFGFFRKRFAHSLWPRATQWLEQHHPEMNS